MEHKEAIEYRQLTIDDSKTTRDSVRDQQRFNSEDLGHWEQGAKERFSDRTKFQIDLVKPVIDGIAGQLEQLVLGGSVVATGGDSTKEVAYVYDGMLRTIANMSNASRIYKDAARAIVDHGFDACRLKTDYVNSSSFDQDIIIEKIVNPVDRVWIPDLHTVTKHSEL